MWGWERAKRENTWAKGQQEHKARFHHLSVPLEFIKHACKTFLSGNNFRNWFPSITRNRICKDMNVSLPSRSLQSNATQSKSKGNTEQAGCAASAKARTGLTDPKWVVKKQLHTNLDFFFWITDKIGVFDTINQYKMHPWLHFISVFLRMFSYMNFKNIHIKKVPATVSISLGRNPQRT